MALKKLLLRSKLDAKKKSLDALRTKDEEFSVREKEIESAINAVSYTHLTLPTICSV